MPAIVAAFLVALLPALYSYLAGRRLDPNDAALPERLQSHRQHVLIAAVVALTLTSWWTSGHLYWVFVPLIMAATFAGGYPLRRRLYGDTWSLPAYLFWLLRMGLVFGGFWFVAAAAPSLILDSRPYDLPIALTLLVVLLAWQQFPNEVVLKLLRARPLADPELAGKLEQVRARSRVDHVELWIAPGEGGSWTNALALPALRRRAVVFAQPLLDLLDDSETAAIHAHELAHLEHYDRRRLLGLRALNIAIAVLATMVVPRLAMHDSAGWTVLVWLLCLAAAMTAATGRGRRNESESDQRAARLCGDAEALARALEKMTTAARLPRRWRSHQQSTHPDLAERMRALRAGAADTSAPAAAVTIARSPDRQRALVLDADRITWLSGVSNVADDADDAALRRAAARTETILHTDLRELVITAGAMGRPTIRSADRRGRSHKMPLDPADVGRLQAALDRVPVAETAGASGSTAFTLAMVALGALVYVSMISWLRASVPFVLAATVGRRRRDWIVAAAATTSDAAMAAIAGSGDGIAATLALASALLAWAAWLAPDDADDEHDRRTLLRTAGAAGVCAAVFAYVIGSATLHSEIPALMLHDGLRAAPGTVVFAAGAAAALLLLGSWPLRAAGTAVLLAAFAAAGLATDTFRLRAFPVQWTEAPYLTPERLGLAAESETIIDGLVGRVRLAPDGASFAVQRLEPATSAYSYMPRPTGSWTVVRDDSRNEVEAIDLAMLAGDRMLAVRRGSGPEAVLLAHGREQPLWRASLRRGRMGRLTVDSRDMWLLTGQAFTASASRVTYGTLAGPAVSSMRWPLPQDAQEAGRPAGNIAATAAGALMATQQHEAGGYDALSLLVLGEHFGTVLTTVRLLRQDGSSTLAPIAGDVVCRAVEVESPRFLCMVTVRERTTFVDVDTQAGTTTALASIPGEAWRLDRAADGRWLARARRVVTVLETSPLRTTTLELPCDCIDGAVDVAGDILVAVESSESRSTIRRYRLLP